MYMLSFQVPPQNTDVVIKKSTDEQRQDIKPSFPCKYILFLLKINLHCELC